MIPWNNESVWLDALPQNKTVSRWPVFHGSVILPYILKAIWCINMILWANKSVWLGAWPQNKSWSMWPIFHGSVAYILKTILCIRRWHWPGVYVSPCSLALVCFEYSTFTSTMVTLSPIYVTSVFYVFMLLFSFSVFRGVKVTTWNIYIPGKHLTTDVSDMGLGCTNLSLLWYWNTFFYFLIWRNMFRKQEIYMSVITLCKII